MRKRNRLPKLLPQCEIDRQELLKAAPALGEMVLLAVMLLVLWLG